MGVFNFKRFSVDDSGCGMKISSDSVLLAAWFLQPYSQATTLADIGAGSGVLSLIGAQICATAAITAIELESNAARAAKLNFETSPWSSRLRLIEGDFALFTPSQRFELIISNPPYFNTGERAADTSRATARHQSEELNYHTLLEKASLWLDANGHLGFISPTEFEDNIVYNAELHHLKLRRLVRVHTTQKKTATRLLWDFSLSDGTTVIENINLRNADGSPADEYIKIVDPFYVKI